MSGEERKRNYFRKAEQRLSKQDAELRKMVKSVDRPARGFQMKTAPQANTAAYRSHPCKQSVHLHSVSGMLRQGRGAQHST